MQWGSKVTFNLQTGGFRRDTNKLRSTATNPNHTKQCLYMESVRKHTALAYMPTEDSCSKLVLFSASSNHPNNSYSMVVYTKTKHTIHCYSQQLKMLDSLMVA